MALEFVIIPIHEKFFDYANNVRQKLENNVRLTMTIHIDTDYETLFSARVNKWKKRVYDIISIDEEYDTSNSIIVRFSDKGSRPQMMDVDEFIDLVSSFDDDDDDEDENGEQEDKEKDENGEQENGEKDEDNEDNGCIIQ